MFLKKLKLNNFKNYDQANIELTSSINCFIGDNGQGKTNLLEAIYYLSFCKSCFNIADQQNIKIGETYFFIEGTFIFDDNQDVIACGVQNDRKKKVSRNKKEYKKLADHIGLIPIVITTPSDIQLIYGSADERRRFLNTLISQHDRLYLQNLIDYNRALDQRNKLLKIFKKQNYFDADSIDIWENTLADNAQKIFETRQKYTELLQPYFQKYYTFISGGNEQISLQYKSDLYEDNLKNLIVKNRDIDRAIQHTTKGIHRDDLLFNIGDRNIKKTGSQGQQKSFLVSLKFAQFDLIKNMQNKKPILLLDDVFDKLDANRVKNIVELVSSDNFGQIFITDADKIRIDNILKKVNSKHKLFVVKNKVVTEINN